MIPISLITGFLGSGKTTFLEHLAGQTDRVVFLVNEFSRVDIDGPRLRGYSGRVVSLPGGSIFCRCLVTEFIRVLRELAQEAAQADPPWRGLVIEASGMSNPKVIGRMLAETGLGHEFRLASVVAVVDPGSFHKLMATLPNIRDQIETADTVLVNKADCYAESVLGEVESKLREIQPHARVARTIHARIELNLFGAHGDAGKGLLVGDYAPCRDPRYAVVQTALARSIDTDRLAEVLRGCGDDLYRAKGLLRTGAGWRRLDCSASGIVFRACEGPVSGGGELVLLVRGGSEEVVTEKVLRPLAQGRLDAVAA